MVLFSAAFLVGDWISRRNYLAAAVGLTVVAGAAMFVSAR